MAVCNGSCLHKRHSITGTGICTQRDSHSNVGKLDSEMSRSDFTWDTFQQLFRRTSLFHFISFLIFTVLLAYSKLFFIRPSITITVFPNKTPSGFLSLRWSHPWERGGYSYTKASEVGDLRGHQASLLGSGEILKLLGYILRERRWYKFISSIYSTNSN